MTRYEEVYYLIASRIVQGTYPEGSILPSEAQMLDEFQVSRHTVRKALDMLMENAYILKRQGKGSLVLGRERLIFPISGLTSYKELQEIQGFESATKVVSLERKKINAEVAAYTGFNEGDTAWFVLRARLIDGEAVITDNDVILTTFVPHLDTQIAENSIYAYLEDELGLEIAYANKEITVDSLNDDDHHYLNLRKFDNNIVSVKSKVYLGDASFFQYTESRHRVDKFRFVDFARRRKTLI
ncbi:MAG: trehalose operon repressor [Clostridiales Family XIII bacterium]|nr:trehalose operon repressor [Clostridiales Family XIII bacterium]